MMKITILAVLAVAASLTHSRLNPDGEIGAPLSLSDMAALNSEPSICICNYEGEDTYHMVAQTSEGTSYQPWYSSDEMHWLKHGTVFSGDGKLRMISIQNSSAAETGQLFVKLIKN